VRNVNRCVIELLQDTFFVKVIANKEYPDIFGSFSPKGAYYVSLGHRPRLAYNHILSPEGAT
jgi:hypothetical protein